MAEFDVARLITVLGARFEPTGFEAFDKAIDHAAREATALRQELTKGYSTSALRDYEMEIAKAERLLEKLRKTTVQANAEVSKTGAVRYRRPAGHEQAGKFVKAETVIAEQRAIDEAIVKTERRIYALGTAAEATSRKVENLALSEERSAVKVEGAFDKVRMALASVEVAAGEASFKLEDLSAAEIEHLTKVAMARERSTVAFEKSSDRVVAGFHRQEVAAERAALRESAAMRGRDGGSMLSIGRPSTEAIAQARHSLAPMAAQIKTLELQAQALQKSLAMPEAFVGGIENAKAMEAELVQVKATLATLNQMALPHRQVLETEKAYATLNKTVRRTGEDALEGRKSLARMTEEERAAASAARSANHAHSEFVVTLRELAKFAAITFGAEQIFEQIKKTQEAANLFQETQARLRVALKNAGLSWVDYNERIERTTKALREQTGFTDFDIQDSLANAIRAVGKAGTEAQRYSKAWGIVSSALDIARTKHIGLAQATSIVARAAGGYTLGLTRLGIQVVKTTDAQDKVRKNMRDHASAFAVWREQYQKWVGDQVASLRYNRANSLAIHNFVDATKTVIAEKKREFGATREQEQAELKHAKAIDRAHNAQKALQLVQTAFAGQAEAYGKTLSGAWARFKANIDATRESTSNELLPALTQVVDYMSSHVVQRMGDEINAMNSTWIDMAHSIRDVALSALPAAQGGMEMLVVVTKEFFAVLAPTLGVLRSVVETVGGANIGVFVASMWGSTKAIALLGRLMKTLPVITILDMGKALMSAESEAGRLKGAFAELRAGMALMGASLGPEGWVALGIAAIATAVYYLSTQESELQKQDAKLRDSLEKNASAFEREMQAIDGVKNSTLALKDARLALKDTDAEITVKQRERARLLTALASLEKGGVTKQELPYVNELKKRIRSTNSDLEHLNLNRQHDLQTIKDSRAAQKKASDDELAQRQKVIATQKVAVQTALTHFGATTLTAKQSSDLQSWVLRQQSKPLGQGAQFQGISWTGSHFQRGPDVSNEAWRQFMAQRDRVVRQSPGDTSWLTQMGNFLRTQVTQHGGEYSGSFRQGMQSVLSMLRDPTQAATLNRQRVSSLMRHGDVAPAVAPLQEAIGRRLTGQEFRFVMSNRDSKNLAAILDFAKEHKRLPSKKEIRVEINKHSVLDLQATYNRLVKRIHDPKINASYDPAQVAKTGNNIGAILHNGIQNGMSAFKLHFTLPDGTSVDSLIAQGIKSTPGAGGAVGGVLTIPITGGGGGSPTQTPTAPGPQQSPPGGAPQPPSATTKARGGPIRKPTLTLMGEEAPRYIEYVFSTNPRDRGPNMAAFQQLARTYGLDVSARAHGTAGQPVDPSTWGAGVESGTIPGTNDPTVTKLLNQAKGTQKGHATTTRKKGRTPLQIWQDELQGTADAYTYSYDKLDLAAAIAERSKSTNDDYTVSQAIIALEQNRLSLIRRQLRDPRFRQFTTSGTQQDRNTAQQERNSLLTEQASLYRDITTRIQQGPQVDLDRVLTPKEQYQLANAARTSNPNVQHDILTKELARLESMRKKAVSSKQWGLASQITAREADVQSQLQSLGPNEAGTAYLEQLRTEAAELLSPAGFFQRDVRATRAARGGHYSGVPASPLAPMAAGVVSVVNVNTLHPSDPRTLRAIHRANGSATAGAPHRRNPRIHVYG